MIRLAQPQDLLKYKQWFIDRWGQAPDNLPRLCVVAGVDGDGYIDKAVGWIYHDTSCGVGWIGWVVSNPDNSKADVKYIDHLFQGMEIVAKNNNIKTLLYTAEKSSMINLLKNRGYIVGDENLTHLIKNL